MQTNLQGFYGSIDTYTDTRIGIVVKKDAEVDGRRYSEFLSADIDMNANIVRINQVVIENSLWVLSAFIENKLSAQLSDSTLKLKKENFFRKDSLKYFVIVTDDSPFCDLRRAGGICGLFPLFFNVFDFRNKLISQFSKWGGIDKIRFVGIVSPDDHRGRREYGQLIGYPEISGKLYDVTAEDWYTHFTDLSEEIITEATVGVRYRLGKLALHVSSVTIDGTALVRSSYHLDGNHIVFGSGVLDASKEQNIDITYDTREENPNPGWQ